VQTTILMLAIFVLGVLARNRLLTIAAACLALFSAARFGREVQCLQPFFLNLGVLSLLFALLLPLISGNVEFKQIAAAVLSREGLIALGIGVWATVLGRLGVGLLHVRPEIILGITFGSIAGTAFFQGIPVGPLVAAGLVASLLSLSRRIF
jgi:uncharacterized membrane protein (DUF441 family)